MELELLRISSGEKTTLGAFYIDDEFQSFTLEDQFQTEKVFGETRIPAGIYDIRLRKAGGFHKRYKKRFPDMHKGMLWLQDVPNFEFVLIHIGNRGDDTAGCILVGNGVEQNVTEEGFVSASAAAYRRIYVPIAAALEKGEAVTIEIIDYA